MSRIQSFYGLSGHDGSVISRKDNKEFNSVFIAKRVPFATSHSTMFNGKYTEEAHLPSIFENKIQTKFLPPEKNVAL